MKTHLFASRSHRPTRRLAALLLALLCLLSQFPAVSATALVPCMTVDASLLLIGDSNTMILVNKRTDLQPATTFARSGARIQETVQDNNQAAYGYSKSIYQLLDELNGSEFDRVVINMGTNNVGMSISSFGSSYRLLLENLYGKNPNAVIYVCLILPTNPANAGSGFSPAAIKKVNDEVTAVQAEFSSSGFDVRLLDLNTPFSDADGVLLSQYDNGSGVHLTDAGYLELDRVLQTVLAQDDPSKNHVWDGGEVLVEPSCVPGFIEYSCTVCGCKKGEVLAATEDHMWVEPWVSKEPTCTSPGELSYPCAICGAVMTEALPATGHSWNGGAVVTPASCTQDGVLRYTCQVCNTTRDETLPALGHAWSLTQQLTAPGGDNPHGGTGLYTCARCGGTKQARLCAAEVFLDMPAEGNWAHKPIDWAWLNNITSGTSENRFSPRDSCTRGQVVTFLWNAAGCPAPTTAQNPFVDVIEGKYYYKAVLWALEQGITSGMDDTHFGPKAPCDRAAVVTFLWNAAGKPEPWDDGSGSSVLPDCPFTDVKTGAYYYKALLWAYTTGVASGIDKTHFDPKGSCTRAQVVTFLYYAAQ